MVKWIHIGEHAKCLLQEDFVKESCQGSEVRISLAEVKEVTLPRPLWPLSFQLHLPFTLNMNLKHGFVSDTSRLGNKGNSSSY